MARPTTTQATLQLLPDLQPLAERLRAVLSDLSPPQADALAAETERLGRALLFQGERPRGEELDRQLRGAGLRTSLNLRQVAPALAPAQG